MQTWSLGSHQVIFLALLFPSRLDVDEYRHYLDNLRAAGWVNAANGDSEWEFDSFPPCCSVECWQLAAGLVSGILGQIAVLAGDVGWCHGSSLFCMMRKTEPYHLVCFL